jgi:hypothetical protein
MAWRFVEALNHVAVEAVDAGARLDQPVPKRFEDPRLTERDSCLPSFLEVTSQHVVKETMRRKRSCARDGIAGRI